MYIYVLGFNSKYILEFSKACLGIFVYVVRTNYWKTSIYLLLHLQLSKYTPLHLKEVTLH